MTAAQKALTTLLHRQTPDGQPWKGAPAVLAAAFVVRAAIALSNDFVIHNDEIMQYLEPAHLMAFGNGVLHWEHVYGGRLWLVPGAIAGVLKLFDAVGLGQPFWYVGGVKLALCAISLVIPWGMYVFARRHFGESTARVALVAGALWYELAVLAHKPMAEFLATAPFVGLLALAVRPSVDDRVWWAPVLATLTAALRMQYAPLALVLLAVVLLRARRRLPMALVAAGTVLAVGVFDAVTWTSGLFHSYVLNVHYNFAADHHGVSPPWEYAALLVVNSGGLCAIVFAASLCSLRRYGFVLALTALILILHSFPAHKEYRFVFAVVPLWLVLGADILTRLTSAPRRWATPTVAAVFTIVSSLGGLNLLRGLTPRAFLGNPGDASLARTHDPAFAAYRYLARGAGVKAVWQPDRRYHSTPGYYYLHRKVPFYDAVTGRSLIPDAVALRASVSHIVTARRTDGPFPGYSLERAFGPLRILRREENHAPVRQWRSYALINVVEPDWNVVTRIDPDAPAPPFHAGIRFTGPTAGATKPP